MIVLNLLDCLYIRTLSSKMKFSITFFILLVCILFQDCNTDSRLAPGIYFEGITVTDANGNIISDDPDNWQPRMDSSNNLFGIYPAYQIHIISLVQLPLNYLHQ